MTTKEVKNMLTKFIKSNVRKITQFHIHHTYLPNYSHFNGSNHFKIQSGMRDFHVNINKWGDIAQHLTLFPDGTWLLGRALNKTPISIRGWNTGAIAVEMVGDFDIGKDKMTKEQKEAILEIAKLMLDLKVENKFHRDNPTAGKTCPGSGIDRKQFMEEVKIFGKKEAPIVKKTEVKEVKEVKEEEEEEWVLQVKKSSSDPGKWKKLLTALIKEEYKFDVENEYLLKYLPNLITKLSKLKAKNKTFDELVLDIDSSEKVKWQKLIHDIVLKAEGLKDEYNFIKYLPKLLENIGNEG